MIEKIFEQALVININREVRIRLELFSENMNETKLLPVYVNISTRYV